MRLTLQKIREWMANAPTQTMKSEKPWDGKFIRHALQYGGRREGKSLAAAMWAMENGSKIVFRKSDTDENFKSILDQPIYDEMEEFYGRSPAIELLPQIKKDNKGRRGDLKILDAKNILTSIVHEQLGENFNQEDIMSEADEVKEELRTIQNTLFQINLHDPRAVAKHQEKLAELAGYMLDMLMAARRAARS